MSKYEPLKRFLIDQLAAELPLSFADVEATLGFPLPRSARRHAPWWANETEGGHVQARAWLDAGWKTSRVDVRRERVVFVRPRHENAGLSGRRPGHDAGPDSTSAGSMSVAASRLLADYAADAGGDMSQAIARAVHEAAIARRGRLIDEIVSKAPRVPVDSIDLLREDRDGR
jgi:hypothetical protein